MAGLIATAALIGIRLIKLRAERVGANREHAVAMFLRFTSSPAPISQCSSRQNLSTTNPSKFFRILVACRWIGGRLQFPGK
jgi:hypothetical protein